MIRPLVSTLAAALLLASPIVASAATTPAKPAKTAPVKPVAATATPAKPVAKPAAKKMMTKAAPRRDSGSAAVDALNDKSLAAARGQ